jgi:glycosyltransferase involved in cell wall biosynthesis
MLITIVICTYNRADILKTTLPCYNALIIPQNVTLEVIIVDNNSSDETPSLVKEFIKSSSSEAVFSYIFEEKQGVSHARNAGYQKASGDYIGYLDDECILPEQWLKVALSTIELHHPAFLGGPYYGKFLPGTTSKWCKESFGDGYIVDFDLPNGPMVGNYLSEGNMFVRKDVFEKIGLFDTELGMSGGTINYGEGPDFQRRFIEKYPDEVIWYNPRFFVWHLIRDEKISIKYRFKEALIRGQSSAKTKKYSISELLFSPFLLLFFVARAMASFVWKLAQSLFSKEHFFSLLYQDYKRSVWRDIGSAMYRSKLLIRHFLCRKKND